MRHFIKLYNYRESLEKMVSLVEWEQLDLEEILVRTVGLDCKDLLDYLVQMDLVVNLDPLVLEDSG